ncbi:hypothetical protein K0H71_14825 [Bacillus sp. IITD106]|nr:hypothetical protein [Bacillus sp. IITD106]
MIIWNVENEDEIYQMEIGPITILKGSHNQWFQLIRYIDDFFTNKNSNVKIYEDTQLIHKKDWECIFIPFDAHLELDKINSRSPLRFLVDEIMNELSLSPVYQELTNLWEEIIEEIHLIGEKLNKYNLRPHMNNLEIDHFKKHLVFHSIKQMMPMEYKGLLLQLYADRLNDKKRLFIIELPELYSTEKQISDYFHMVNQLSRNGMRFIIVTNSEQIKGNINYIFDEVIINEALIENIKRKVLTEIPFYCDDELFNHAKEVLIRTVDNYNENSSKETNSHQQTDSIQVLLYVISYHLNMGLNLDLTDIPTNLYAFLKTYS